MAEIEQSFIDGLEKKYAGNNGFTEFEKSLLRIAYAAGMEESKPALDRCYEWLCTAEAVSSPYHRESKEIVEKALFRMQAASVESNRIVEIELNA